LDFLLLLIPLIWSSFRSKSVVVTCTVALRKR
jgi:hypothetical protein